MIEKIERKKNYSNKSVCLLCEKGDRNCDFRVNLCSIFFFEYFTPIAPNCV